MSTGSVKWFSTVKGYGFIQPDNGGDDVFVHMPALQRSKLASLNEGQRVSFELELNKRSGKTAAEKIQVL